MNDLVRWNFSKLDSKILFFIVLEVLIDLAYYLIFLQPFVLKLNCLLKSYSLKTYISESNKDKSLKTNESLTFSETKSDLFISKSSLIDSDLIETFLNFRSILILSICIRWYLIIFHLKIKLMFSPSNKHFLNKVFKATIERTQFTVSFQKKSFKTNRKKH